MVTGYWISKGDQGMDESETRILHEDEYDKWDDLISNSMQSSVFHKAVWINTSAKLLNKKVLIFANFKNDTLTGGCHLFVDRFPSISAISNLILSPYGGFILRRDQEKNTFSICKSISKEIAKCNFSHINIINSPALKDVRPFTWSGWRPDLYYTYIFPLTGDIDKRILKNARWSIRKARKEGIRSKKRYDFDSYWNLNVDTYRKQGKIPPFTREYLKGMTDMIINNKLGEMHIAETETGENAAAEFVIWDEHMVHDWSAASNPKFYQTEAPSLLLFEILENLQQRGFKNINLMMGNMPNLTSFASRFNPSLVPYFGVSRTSKKYQILKHALKFKSLVLR
jgi:hypothetical protein